MLPMFMIGSSPETKSKFEDPNYVTDGEEMFRYLGVGDCDESTSIILIAERSSLRTCRWWRTLLHPLETMGIS